MYYIDEMNPFNSDLTKEKRKKFLRDVYKDKTEETQIDSLSPSQESYLKRRQTQTEMAQKQKEAYAKKQAQIAEFERLNKENLHRSLTELGETQVLKI
jgi:hypothetical protein